MNKDRENNFDWLRMTSMIAVIVLHVSAIYISSHQSETRQNVNYISLVAAEIYNCLSRFAVPCFVMLSGAFLLENENNSDFVSFYKKSFNKIGIPLIVFSLLYSLYSVFKMFSSGENLRDSIEQATYNLICGSPFPHMWYSFMTIGLYFLAPITIMWKQKTSEKAFNRFAFVFLLAGVIGGWISYQGQYAWNIGLVAQYYGYFLVGYVIKKWAEQTRIKRSLILVVFLIAISLLLYISYFAYTFEVVNSIRAEMFGLDILSYFAPWIAIASVCVFVGFSLIKCNKNSRIVSGLVKYSFYIYLIHRGILDIVHKGLLVVFGPAFVDKLSGLWMIPIISLFILLVSLFLSILYEKINNMLIKVFGLR